MMATWCQASADDFIEAGTAGWVRGVTILHFLGGHSADIVGNRAIAQAKYARGRRWLVADPAE